MQLFSFFVILTACEIGGQRSVYIDISRPRGGDSTQPHAAWSEMSPMLRSCIIVIVFVIVPVVTWSRVQFHVKWTVELPGAYFYDCCQTDSNVWDYALLFVL